MLTLHELALSPNNTKVYMALRYKGIPFEVSPVSPFDRSAVREVSGQDLTPVIEDRGIVLNDSEAILQYLDANYRDAPRLFPSDRDGRKACDAFKDEVDRRVARHWVPVFFFAIGFRKENDPKAAEAYAEGLRWLDGEIGEKEWIRGEESPVCDLRVAEFATYAFPGEGFAARVPFVGRVRDAFGLDPDDYPNLVRHIAPWNDRLA